MDRTFAALSVLVLSACALADNNSLSDQEKKDGWSLLFNGKNLSGWHAIGNREAFSVDAEGNLACAGKDGLWIATDAEYKDFMLKADFKISPGGNSGVFLRATAEGDPAFTGMEIQILDDHGKYDDKDKRIDSHATGSLYDAVPPSKNMSKATGEWNSYEITCFGNELRVTLNGEQLYAINLDTTPDTHNSRAKLSMRAPTGFIGLQDHGSPVWFRNIKLKKLDPSEYPGNTAGWVSAFDGKSLEGWTPHGASKWSVVDGAIVGTNGQGYLFSNKNYRDVELRAKARVNKGGNSGIFFRSTHPAEGSDRAWPVGGEAQLDNNAKDFPTGSIYGRHRGAEMFSRDGEWFDYYVHVVGDHWIVRVNGHVVLDTRESKWMDSGFIAFQAHDPDGKVEFKDIQIRSHDGAE